jgi:acetolactate synthase-1/3 small subunit
MANNGTSTQKYTLSCLVENHFGVLARIAGLISARGFNIDSLAVSATEDPTISRMTIVVDADSIKLEQVKNQLNRLIDVIDVKELKESQFLDRELLLAKVSAKKDLHGKLEAVLKPFDAKIADVFNGSVVIEATGSPRALDHLVDQLRDFGIVALVRTGRVALER